VCFQYLWVATVLYYPNSEATPISAQTPRLMLASELLWNSAFLRESFESPKCYS
jgi:hypothetical protein